MAAAANGREELINLLLESDDDLRKIVDGFFAQAPAPRFPVEHAHLTVITCVDHVLSWESTTTRLAKLGFAFGDVLKGGDKLHRAIAHADDGALWVTSDISSDGISKYSNPSNFKRHDGEIASDASERIRLAEVVKSCSNDIESVVRDLPGSLKPRFRAEPKHLEFKGSAGGIAFDWSSMTTDLRDKMGCAFGDVLLYKNDGHLYRAVACRDGLLWTTSNSESNVVGCFPTASRDDFEKM